MIPTSKCFSKNAVGQQTKKEDGSLITATHPLQISINPYAKTI